MVTISKTLGEHLYINLLNFKDKEEQEYYFDLIKALIEKPLPSNETFVCKYCLNRFYAEFMNSPNQYILCFNNPFRTKENK